jgi:hypothetical protein
VTVDRHLFVAREALELAEPDALVEPGAQTVHTVFLTTI